MTSAHALSTPNIGDAAIALAGPAAAGVCIGIAQGGSAMLECAAIVPLISFGLTAFMVPALFIGAAYVGPVPAAAAFARATLYALRNAGVVLLGLAAPLAFLVATTLHPNTSLAFGAAALAAAGIIGLRSLVSALWSRESMSSASVLLFVFWSCAYLAIGATLYAEFIRRASCLNHPF
ncbi:MAG: hypothetical protein HYY84_09520 [Deltaproteobacteria bacterium]|nr:hypothetical protein [Deltaproteobacteria bacterium]